MDRRFVMAASLALLLAYLILRRGWAPEPEQRGLSPAASAGRPAHAPESRMGARAERWVRIAKLPSAERPASEVVREKVAQFGRSRRELALKLASRKGVQMTPEIENFFAAVESGQWERIEQTFKAINGGDSSAGHTSARSPEVSAMWPAIIDAFGVAEQAHLWPAESLLDYGYSILESLKPGMVYVGGTDASRWVPALLNDTAEGERHIVITQNGLADSSYLDYVRLQFGEQLNALTTEDEQTAFQAYIEDARRRLLHDQEFPQEPKQVRPGEEISMKDGKINVGGKVAVMDINERLLLKLVDKNPELSFGLGESFPLKKTYADAVPLGPIMASVHAGSWVHRGGKLLRSAIAARAQPGRGRPGHSGFDPSSRSSAGTAD